MDVFIFPKRANECEPVLLPRMGEGRSICFEKENNTVSIGQGGLFLFLRQNKQDCSKSTPLFTPFRNDFLNPLSFISYFYFSFVFFSLTAFLDLESKVVYKTFTTKQPTGINNQSASSTGLRLGWESHCWNEGRRLSGSLVLFSSSSGSLDEFVKNPSRRSSFTVSKSMSVCVSSSI